MSFTVSDLTEVHEQVLHDILKTYRVIGKCSVETLEHTSSIKNHNKLIHAIDELEESGLIDIKIWHSEEYGVVVNDIFLVYNDEYVTDYESLFKTEKIALNKMLTQGMF